jgi:hypothetical protein
LKHLLGPANHRSLSPNFIPPSRPITTHSLDHDLQPQHSHPVLSHPIPSPPSPPRRAGTTSSAALCHK